MQGPSQVGGALPLPNQYPQTEPLSTLSKFAAQINTFANNPYNANAEEFAKIILQLSKEAKSV